MASSYSLTSFILIITSISCSINWLFSFSIVHRSSLERTNDERCEAFRLRLRRSLWKSGMLISIDHTSDRIENDQTPNGVRRGYTIDLLHSLFFEREAANKKEASPQTNGFAAGSFHRIQLPASNPTQKVCRNTETP